MNSLEIKSLQNIIMGYSFQESILNKAIYLADTLEVGVCLKALKGGRCSFESRMTMQDFVCRLDKFTQL
jgi:hypothetical protein